MTIIGKPDWESIRRSTDLKEFTLVDERMGYPSPVFAVKRESSFAMKQLATGVFTSGLIENAMNPRCLRRTS